MMTTMMMMEGECNRHFDEGRKGGDGDPSYDADGLPTFHPVRASTLERDACIVRETDGDNDENDRTGHGKAGKSWVSDISMSYGYEGMWPLIRVPFYDPVRCVFVRLGRRRRRR